MIRFRHLAVLALFLGGALSAHAEQPAKPNFVFILIDDMGWADCGCYGSTFHETPNIDKLAKQGMKFTDAYAACCVCSPTRASIIAGKYPARLHITDWLPGRTDRPSQKLLRPKIEQALPLTEISLARALKPAGYASASIGKWHLGGPDHSPVKHGFDLNVGGSARGSPPGYFFPYRLPKNSPPLFPDSKPGEFLTERLTTEAEKFIDQNKDKPFFLYLAHYSVHIPLEAKKDVIAKYAAKAKPTEKQNNPLYAAMVESVDDSVGRVMKKLDDLKIADRTIVVFTSDNGGLSVREGVNTPATSNAPLQAGKGFNYEGGIREPLIVRWPGAVKPGSTCDVPVLSMDFYPTFLELAGVKPEAKQVIDGVSLLPLLKQTAGFKREAIFWHYPHYSNQGGRPSGAVRQGAYKLIEFYEDGKRELYNLKDDIGEKNDLSAKMPDKTKELAKLLDDWRQDVKAQLPTVNPAYAPPKQ